MGDAIVDSYCFSQGEGYAAMVELAGQVSDIRTNSIAMMAVAAIFGIFNTIEVYLELKEKECGAIDKVFAVIAVLGVITEAAYSIFDFSTNTISTIAAVEAIEMAVMGDESVFASGYVCMQVHPEKLPIELPGVSLPIAQVILGTIGGMLMLVVCCMCPAVTTDRCCGGDDRKSEKSRNVVVGQVVGSPDSNHDV